MGQITPDTIRRYLFHLEETGHNPGGIHASYRSLKSFLRWYWKENEIPCNPPIAKVKAPRVSIDQLEPARLDDITEMLKTCAPDFFGCRDRAAILVLLDTGIRVAEFIAMNIGDLLLTTGAVLIREGKGRKPRTVFLSQTTRRAVIVYLKMRQDDNPALWLANNGEKLTYWGLRQLVERRAQKAGVEAPSLHSFRRLTREEVRDLRWTVESAS